MATCTMLAPSLLASDSPAAGNLQSRRTNSSLGRNASMFNSLKHKLSRSPSKGNEQSTTYSSNKQPNLHPQMNNTPSPRRPANPPGTNNPFRDMGEAPPPYSAAPGSQAPSFPALQPQPAAPQLGTGLLPYPAPVASSSAYAAPSTATQQDDDPYAFLSSFDTIFLIDDSGSMAGGRWRETKEALQRITPICTAHDADGIDIFFLNTPDAPGHHNITRPDQVDRIFSTVRPGGATPTGQKLDTIILRPYIERYIQAKATTKPINIICITDGQPSDDVESPIIQIAKRLDKADAPAWQVGIQFFQVGHDEHAKAHLKALDDELANIAGDSDMRDIVDTVPFSSADGGMLTGDGILKVVLGAVNRRLDRKKSKDLHR